MENPRQFKTQKKSPLIFETTTSNLPQERTNFPAKPRPQLNQNRPNAESGTDPLERKKTVLADSLFHRKVDGEGGPRIRQDV